MFVSFEGGEGAGKSTQAEVLANRLQLAGRYPLLVHEPGTTSLGVYLRRWLKRPSDETISHGAEVFLFAAARAELVAKVVKPALYKNGIVIADRFADSTEAYQGYGRRIRLRTVRTVNSLATQQIVPDLTFLLDCEPEEGLKRVGSVQIRLPLDQRPDVSRMDDEGTRRFEEESLEFHHRVREGYRAMAKRQPDRWCVIEATKPTEEISSIIWSRVEQALAQADSASLEDSLPELLGRDSVPHA